MSIYELEPAGGREHRLGQPARNSCAAFGTSNDKSSVALQHGTAYFGPRELQLCNGTGVELNRCHNALRGVIRNDSEVACVAEHFNDLPRQPAKHVDVVDT